MNKVITTFSYVWRPSLLLPSDLCIACACTRRFYSLGSSYWNLMSSPAYFDFTAETRSWRVWFQTRSPTGANVQFTICAAWSSDDSRSKLEWSVIISWYIFHYQLKELQVRKHLNILVACIATLLRNLPTVLFWRNFLLSFVYVLQWASYTHLIDIMCYALDTVVAYTNQVVVFTVM